MQRLIELQELLLFIVFFITIGSKHGRGTQKDCLILYLLDPSFKHVVETKWQIHIEILI
jgi:hypothetical protein